MGADRDIWSSIALIHKKINSIACRLFEACVRQPKNKQMETKSDICEKIYFKIVLYIKILPMFRANEVFTKLRDDLDYWSVSMTLWILEELILKSETSQSSSPSGLAQDNFYILSNIDRSVPDPRKMNFPHEGQLNSVSNDDIDMFQS